MNAIITTRDLIAPIGQIAEWNTPGYAMRVSVRITDARLAYGKPTYQIEPLHGSGSAWVSVERLTNVRPEETNND